MSSPDSTAVPSPLDRARAKAYRRLLPLLFLCYVIAYVDRNNVSIAFDTMKQDLPGFNNDVLGTGFGIFFLGYFLLEIPGTLLVEKWSARKWISRIMISWGIVAALTAFVKTPDAVLLVRFLLGLAEAGFFPGVIVYLTHWFPSRDRARALSWFLIGTPIAQFASPLLSYPLLKIGTDEIVNGTTVHHPRCSGLEGWQWVYIAWGIPAVVLGFVVLLFLTDRPGQANWLDARGARGPGGGAGAGEGAARRRATAHDLARGPQAPQGAAAGRRLLLHRDGQLRRRVVPADDPRRSGTSLSQGPAPLAADHPADRARSSASSSSAGAPTAPRSAGCTRRCRSTWGPRRWPARCCIASIRCR